MATASYAGVEITLNDEGFFTDPTQWTKEVAVEMAAKEGLSELTPKHWQVLDFQRKEYFDKGTGAAVRALGKSSGVSVKELYELFPNGPAKQSARLAGIPKPKGCI